MPYACIMDYPLWVYMYVPMHARGPPYIGRCGCTDSLNHNFAIVFIYYLQLWVCTPTHLHSALWATHMWRIVGQVLHHASIYIVVSNCINLAMCAPMQYTVGTTQ